MAESAKEQAGAAEGSGCQPQSQGPASGQPCLQREAQAPSLILSLERGAWGLPRMPLMKGGSEAVLKTRCPACGQRGDQRTGTS